MLSDVFVQPPTPDTSLLRREALRNALLSTVDALARCRAADIAESDIDAYVALDWLVWSGGSLQLTTTGRNVCQQLRQQVAAQQAEST